MGVFGRSRLPDSYNERIRQLVADGLSWRQVSIAIAKPIGTVMTRGRMLGLKTKQSRCGLKAPIVSTPRQRGQTRIYPVKPAHPPIVDNGLGHAIDTGKAFTQKRSIPLMDAGAEHCRWPIDGDRQPRCCGGPITRASYCDEHARRAFNT